MQYVLPCVSQIQGIGYDYVSVGLSNTANMSDTLAVACTNNDVSAYYTFVAGEFNRGVNAVPEVELGNPETRAENGLIFCSFELAAELLFVDPDNSSRFVLVCWCCTKTLHVQRYRGPVNQMLPFS